jgi:hypothetical protein
MLGAMAPTHEPPKVGSRVHLQASADNPAARAAASPSCRVESQGLERAVGVRCGVQCDHEPEHQDEPQSRGRCSGSRSQRWTRLQTRCLRRWPAHPPRTCDARRSGSKAFSVSRSGRSAKLRRDPVVCRLRHGPRHLGAAPTDGSRPGNSTDSRQRRTYAPSFPSRMRPRRQGRCPSLCATRTTTATRRATTRLCCPRVDGHRRQERWLPGRALPRGDPRGSRSVAVAPTATNVHPGRVSR